MNKHTTMPEPATAIGTNPSVHVRLDRVTKKLGDFVAVDDVSIDIVRGEMLTLLGPSGCGKSTTLRLLAGFYHPTAGEIYLGAKRITQLPPNQREMTMVFQEYALFPHLTVADNVGYGLKRRGMASAAARKRISEMLDLVSLGSSAEKFPHQLSGGQQQRVALARALAVDPEVLLLDEPLSNLDARLRVKLREEIVRVQRVLGKTMVFVTHDQEEALSISDRIAVMRDGRIEQLGSPAEIYFKPRNRYVAEFVGTANFLQVEVIDKDTVRLGSRTLQASSSQPVGAATLMARPEAMRLSDVQSDKTVPELHGPIERKSFLGSTTRYWVKTSFGEIIVDDPMPRAWEVGSEVDIHIDFKRTHFLGLD